MKTNIKSPRDNCLRGNNSGGFALDGKHQVDLSVGAVRCAAQVSGAYPIQVLLQAAAHGVFVTTPVDDVFLAGLNPLVQRPPVVEFRETDGQHRV